jgi:hypothetical protein
MQKLTGKCPSKTVEARWWLEEAVLGQHVPVRWAGGLRGRLHLHCFIFSVDERNREGEEAADALLVASYFCVRFEPAYRIEARGDVVPRPQRSVLTSGQ